MEAHSSVSVNNVKLEPAPFLTELVMEAYLIENPSVLQLKGYDSVRLQAFECAWTKGDNKKGRIDLLLSYDRETLAVAELKKGLLDDPAFNQLKDYFKDECYKDCCFEFLDGVGNPKWIGILVGSGITPELKSSLEKSNFMLSKDIPIYVLLLNRYKDADNRFVVFSELLGNKNSRSNIKYNFNGKDYGISRFVLALVKACLDKGMVKTDIEKLVAGLSISKSRPFICPLQEALEINEKSPNWYFSEKDAIEIEGLKYSILYGLSYSSVAVITKNACALGFQFKELSYK